MEAAGAADAEFLFTQRWHSRMRLLTYVACGVAVAGCLTADWEVKFGDDHVFSGVKPALKRYFNGIFGVAQPPPPQSSAAAAAGTAAGVEGQPAMAAAAAARGQR
jgi:hypothetical protein